MATVAWIRYSESVWYPARSQDLPRLEHGWRCKLTWPANESPEAWSVGPFQGILHRGDGHIHWSRINKGEYVLEDETNRWTMLPEDVDVDECLVHLRAHYVDDTEGMEFFLDEEPRDMWDADIFEVQLQWDNQGAYLHVNTDIPIRISWHVFENGLWRRERIFASDGGIHRVRVVPPVGDFVFLQGEGDGNTYEHVHRITVVGRPGIASGRYLWHRGTLYNPRDARGLPWISTVVPVFHPSDIERFPRNSRAHQVQWWMEQAPWTDDAIAFAREHFPSFSIMTMGSLDNPGDVIMLKPYELDESLDPSMLYAFDLFADSGDSQYGPQSAWVFDRLRDPRFQHLRFVERLWANATSSTGNPSGTPQYGFGYGFTRGVEHDTLWPMASRNAYLREQKEDFPCATCSYKSACRQLIPSGIAVESNTKLALPWVAIAKSGCALVRWKNEAP